MELDNKSIDILLAWSSGLEIDSAERKKSGISKKSAGIINRALEDGFIDDDESKLLLKTPLKHALNNGLLDNSTVNEFAIKWLSNLAFKHDYFLSFLSDDKYNSFLINMKNIPELSSKYFLAHRFLAMIGGNSINDLIHLLDSDNVDDRLFAAKTLKEFRCKDVLGYSDEINEALENETEDKIKVILEHAINIYYFCEHEKEEKISFSDVPIFSLNGENPSSIIFNRECNKENCVFAKSFNSAKKLYQASDRFKKLGIYPVDHKFFDITLYFIPDTGLHDFRSVTVFDSVTKSEWMKEIVSSKKDLTILYPASGSHMAPLFMLLKLVDSQDIESAKLIYTEIDEKALKRIRHYFDWYSENGIISDLEETHIRYKNDGDEYLFKFKYKGKETTLVFALNRDGGKLWASKNYIKESDVVIFHDGLGSGYPEQRSDFIRELMKMDDKARLIVSEEKWGLKEKKDEFIFENEEIPYTYYDERYGCGSMRTENFRVTKGNIIKDDRFAWKTNELYGHHIHQSLNRGAVLLKISHE